MTIWWTLAMATIAGPWDAPAQTVYYYDPCCRPVQVYCPCTPVFVQAPPIETPLAVAVEKAVSEEAEDADPVGVRRSVLDPVGLRMGLNSLPDMALDWGLATIGPGTLHPTNYAVASSAGFGPGWGNPNGNAFERSVIQIVQPNPPIVPPGTIIGVPPGKPPLGGEPVPEPSTIVIWTFIAVTAISVKRRAFVM